MVRSLLLSLLLAVTLILPGCIGGTGGIAVGPGGVGPDPSDQAGFASGSILVRATEARYGFPILVGTVSGCHGVDAALSDGVGELTSIPYGSHTVEISSRFFTTLRLAVVLDRPVVDLEAKMTVSIDEQQMDEFARLIMAESEGEPYEGKVAVAASVLNRVMSPLYPNNLHDVIFQEYNGLYQYSPVKDGRINNPPNADSVKAAYDALRGRDPSLGALGFYNPALTDSKWVRQQTVAVVIGNHVFWTINNTTRIGIALFGLGYDYGY